MIIRFFALILLILHASQSAAGLAEPLFSVPADIKSRGHVVVEGVVNDRWTLPLVVDTGAMVALMPVQAPQRLSIAAENVRSVHTTTASEVSAMASITLDSITVGDGRLEDVMAVLRDLSMHDTFASAPGVLPFGFLDRYTVHFDLAGGRLEFYAPDIPMDQLIDRSNYSRVPFERPYGFIRFDLLIDGEAIPAILDTGAGGLPVINWAAAQKLGVGRDHPELSEGRDIHGAGHRGLDSAGFAFESVAVGSVPIAVPRVDIADMPHFKQLLGEGPAANIGLQQLRGRSLFINFAASEFYLQQAPQAGLTAAE